MVLFAVSETIASLTSKPESKLKVLGFGQPRRLLALIASCETDGVTPT